jgi:tripartite-type tricarboxylate transporter receptor subunit TctC
MDGRGGPGRRALLGLAASAAALVSGPALASRRAGEVRLLVGAPSGSPTDLWARALAPFLERHWPRLAVGMANRPGEGGVTAARQLAGAPADGRLLAVVTTPALLARCVERAEEALLDRLDILAAVAEEPMVLVSLAAGPAEDLKALKALGENGVLGTPPPGSTGMLAARSLADLGFALARLAFPSAAAARQAVLAGNLSAAMVPLSTAIGGIRDGRLNGLALAAPQRLELLPELPSFSEQGIDLVAQTHRGLVAPLGLPAPRRARLVAGLQSMVVDPEFTAQAADVGYLPRFLGPEAWGEALRGSLAELRERWRDEPWLPGRH